MAPKKKKKNNEKFPKNPGMKYKANTVPKNTGIPGFCKNTVPYRSGMKFIIPLGPACDPRNAALDSEKFNKKITHKYKNVHQEIQNILSRNTG